MNSPRDEIDKWLNAEAAPLYPRTGSLERIRGRARQRKRRQALMTAVGCAVVLAAAVAVPQIVSGRHPASKAAAGRPSSPAIRHAPPRAEHTPSRHGIDGS